MKPWLLICIHSFDVHVCIRGGGGGGGGAQGKLPLQSAQLHPPPKQLSFCLHATNFDCEVDHVKEAPIFGITSFPVPLCGREAYQTASEKRGTGDLD